MTLKMLNVDDEIVLMQLESFIHAVIHEMSVTRRDTNTASPVLFYILTARAMV